MLILGLVGAFACYAGLYLLFEYNQQYLQGPLDWLNALNHMVWMPETEAFQILRNLLLATALYVAMDFLYSSGCRPFLRRSTHPRDYSSIRKRWPREDLDSED